MLPGLFAFPATLSYAHGEQFRDRGQLSRESPWRRGTGPEVLIIRTENDTVKSGMPPLLTARRSLPLPSPEWVTRKEFHAGGMTFSCIFPIFPESHQRLCNNGSASTCRFTHTRSHRFAEVSMAALPPRSMSVPVSPSHAHA